MDEDGREHKKRAVLTWASQWFSCDCATHLAASEYVDSHTLSYWKLY
jgi:hypothetical protein